MPHAEPAWSMSDPTCHQILVLVSCWHPLAKLHRALRPLSHLSGASTPHPCDPTSPGVCHMAQPPFASSPNWPRWVSSTPLGSPRPPPGQQFTGTQHIANVLEPKDTGKWAQEKVRGATSREKQAQASRSPLSVGSHFFITKL